MPAVPDGLLAVVELDQIRPVVVPAVQDAAEMYPAFVIFPQAVFLGDDSLIGSKKTVL